MAKESKKNQNSGQNDAKQKVLDEALAVIEKQFGAGAIMKLGDAALEQIPRIPFAPDGMTCGLDIALGGGLPKGRVIEIYGPESSGKTTMALHAVASIQRAGGTAAFIDAEHALDPIYAKKIGVDTKNLLIAQPDCGEDALQITEQLVSSGAVDIIVIDSVAALTPRAEIEGEMGDMQVGLQARLMSKALRKLTSIVHKTGTTLIFINQIRMKIGVMFGSPETTTGGNALKFYASVRLDIRRIAQIKESDETIGNRTRVKVVKNKTAPPFRVVEFDLMYPVHGTTPGYNFVADMLDLAVNLNQVTKSGAFYTIDDKKIQGRAKTLVFLLENPESLNKITEKLLHAVVTPEGIIADEETGEMKE